MIPTINRIHPIVWIFTPETLSLTAKARTAPAAARKIPTPRPMASPSVRSWLWRVIPLNGARAFPGAGCAGARESFRLGSAADAQGLHRVADRDRRGRGRHRRRSCGIPPVAPHAGLAGGGPNRLRLLVR